VPIVWPTKDVASRDREQRRWEKLFPDHHTVLLEGAGHYMQEDAADEIVTAIRDWRSPGGTPDASSAGRRLRSRDFPIGAVSAPPS
jgi:hypothetical protein